MEASEVRQDIDKLDSLSTIPIVLTQILRATRDPSCPPAELYRIIARDQTIAAKIIRIANSPIFGHSGRVGEIQQAIMFLGYEHIRNIAISVSVVSMFSKRGDINLRNFWAHCYEVAFISSYIAEAATMVSPKVTFLAGLLHDIGRLIFYNLYRDRYKDIFGTDDLLEKEVAAFGCDHAQAGGWFAEKAKLPVEQVLAIQYHHSPSKAGQYADIVSVVSLAEALSRRYSPKIEDDGIWTGEHDAILLELSLNNDDLDEIGVRLSQEQAGIRNFLELI